MIIQKSIARRMKNAMSAEHLSILELAEKLGLARTSVQMYLREKGNPRADTIELIYKNLGLPLDELVNNRDMTQNYEFSDFLSLAGHINSIHPVLMPVVYQSFQMAKKILQLSDTLYDLEAGKDGSEK